MEGHMLNNKQSMENLKIQHAYLEAAIHEEEQHVWKNLIRIEELKKQKLLKKDTLLRMALQEKLMCK